MYGKDGRLSLSAQLPNDTSTLVVVFKEASDFLSSARLEKLRRLDSRFIKTSTAESGVIGEEHFKVWVGITKTSLASG